MLMSLVSTGVFAVDVDVYEISDAPANMLGSEESFDPEAFGHHSITPFNAVMGYVGPSNSFAPWWWYNDDPTTGIVVVGGGNFSGMHPGIWTTEDFLISPWSMHSGNVRRIVFTEPIFTVNNANVSGLFAGLPFLEEIENLGYLQFPATGQSWLVGMFRGPNLLTSLDLSDWDVSNVSRFSNMFRDANHLVEIIGIESWETGSLSRITNMFRGTTSLTSLDLSGWDTSGVTHMDGVFRGANNLEEIIGIEDWNTGSVRTIAHIFRGASGLTSLDLGKWDTSSVDTAEGMASAFRDMADLTSLNLDGWDTSSLGNNHMANMFSGATALREITFGSAWVTATGASPAQVAQGGIPGPTDLVTYTGLWTNVGTGTIYAPEGTYERSFLDLLNNTETPSAVRADTWIWQRRAPSLVVTFASAGNGAIESPTSIGVAYGETIPADFAIYPKPDTGYEFSHWTSSDPAHTGGPFLTSDLHNLSIQ